MAGFKDFLKVAAAIAVEHVEQEKERSDEFYERAMRMKDQELINKWFSGGSNAAKMAYWRAIHDRCLEEEARAEARRRRK